VNLHAHYVEHAKLDAQLTPAQLNINEVSSRTYFNLAGDYKIAHGKNGEVQIFAAVNNLTNLDPPRWMPMQLFLVGNTASYYDSAGRSFTVGARMKF
jgi:outer membrane receptor protein involved in Fe transport